MLEGTADGILETVDRMLVVDEADSVDEPSMKSKAELKHEEKRVGKQERELCSRRRLPVHTHITAKPQTGKPRPAAAASVTCANYCACCAPAGPGAASGRSQPLPSLPFALTSS